MIRLSTITSSVLSLTAFAAAQSSVGLSCDANAASIGAGNNHDVHGMATLTTTAVPMLGGFAGLRLEFANSTQQPAILLYSAAPSTGPVLVAGAPILLDLTQQVVTGAAFVVRGVRDFTFPISNDPGACTGSPIGIQAAILSTVTTGSPFGLVTSNRMDWTLGDRTELVITEINPNPASPISDADGEYFEVYNPNAFPVNMQNWVISDDGSDSETIASELIVPAGGYALLGRTADIGTNGAVTVDYVYGSWFLANSADEVVLTSPFGIEVDRVDYTSSFPFASGSAMSLCPSALDATSNDDPANWQAAVSNYEPSNTGTPGQANDPCMSK